MASSSPFFSTCSTLSMLPALARPPERSIGTCPTTVRNQATRRLAGPPPSANSSALAGKVSRRGMTAGTMKVSTAEVWLHTTMAGPDSGTFSRPVTLGRHTSRTTGKNSDHLKIQ
jgi:hypothetical protein